MATVTASLKSVTPSSLSEQERGRRTQDTVTQAKIKMSLGRQGERLLADECSLTKHSRKKLQVRM